MLQPGNRFSRVTSSLAARLRGARRDLVVLGLAAVLVIATAVTVSLNVSGHLEEAATNEAATAVGAVVHGYVDPLLARYDLLGSPDPTLAASVNNQLAQLTSARRILRIKVWQPNGTVLFSDLPKLRGKSFQVSPELREALDGETATEVTAPDAAENVFEKGLASRVIEIYLPITNGAGVTVGAYEVYQDAAPIEAAISATRQDVLLIVGAIGLLLLALLYAGFHGANRLLADLAGRLRRSEARFRSLVQNSSDLVVLLRPDGTMSYVSPAVDRNLGAVAGSWVGRALVDVVHPEDAGWLEAMVGRLATDPAGTPGGEVRLPHADGRWLWFELVGTNLLDDPDVSGMVLNCRDVTERRELEDQLRHQAFHDPLTALANRPLLIDRIDHELAMRSVTDADALAVMLLDVDDFKTVNDSLGHAAGDRLLIELAERLRGAVRPQDTTARIGGDEFAILVHGAIGDVNATADRLLASMREPVHVEGQRLSAAVSIGIAFVARARTDADELLRNADVAMYMAKAQGKGRSVVYEPSMHHAALRRLRMKADLAGALDTGQFSLRYQPIVNLASGEPIGVEALLRWEHPNGTIGPSDFIPLAEETGLIIPLGNWVLETACRGIQGIDAAVLGSRLELSVNVSALQLAKPAFPADVATILSATGLDPARLVLEVTESSLVERSEGTLATMRMLRELGVRLAIDDFGTGYSSLSYLPEIPVDLLKIDQSFVAALAGGREAQAVIRSIVRLAESLNLTTVAEGIERAEDAARLRTLGAELGQGFLFARPLQPEQLTAYLLALRAPSRRSRSA
jgi:diguanylate cyclase (GGDEF)-like protein/PAS domain S-box-containing protein